MRAIMRGLTDAEFERQYGTEVAPVVCTAFRLG